MAGAGQTQVSRRWTGLAAWLGVVVVLAACEAEPGSSVTAPPTEASTAIGPPEEAPSSDPLEGDWILYQAYFDFGVSDLGLVRQDGTGTRQIPGGPGNRWHPAWSPDGEWIAYETVLPTDVSQIWILEVNGAEERALMPCEDPCVGNGAPAWSPDGQWIVFQTAEPERHPIGQPIAIHRIRPDGTRLEQLTDPELAVLDLHPQFLPDGSGIGYTRCPGTNAQFCPIHLMGTDGSDDRELFSPAGFNPVHVQWRPAERTTPFS